MLENTNLRLKIQRFTNSFDYHICIRGSINLSEKKQYRTKLHV